MALKDKLELPARKEYKVNKDKTAPLDRTVLLVPLERKAHRVLKVSKEIKEFKVQLVLLV